MDIDDYAGFGFYTTDFDSLTNLTNYEKMLLTRIKKSDEFDDGMMFVGYHQFKGEVTEAGSIIDGDGDSDAYFIYIPNTSAVTSSKHYSKEEACAMLNKSIKLALDRIVNKMTDDEIKFANPKQSVEDTRNDMHQTIAKIDVTPIAHDDEVNSLGE